MTNEVHVSLRLRFKEVDPEITAAALAKFVADHVRENLMFDYPSAGDYELIDCYVQGHRDDRD